MKKAYETPSLEEVGTVGGLTLAPPPGPGGGGPVVGPGGGGPKPPGPTRGS